jgi:hypothetical protein
LTGARLHGFLQAQSSAQKLNRGEFTKVESIVSGVIFRLASGKAQRCAGN